MKPDKKNRVCPVEKAGVLDFNIRKWLQNPRRILQPYIKEGMTALDKVAISLNARLSG